MTRVTPYPWPSSRIVCVCVSTPTESKGKEKKLSRLSPSYVTLSRAQLSHQMSSPPAEEKPGPHRAAAMEISA
jgi:hypothetical protein